MNHVKTNLTGASLPRDPNFKPPTSKEEFQKLIYSERVQLQREYPAVYRRFTDDLQMNASRGRCKHKYDAAESNSGQVP